MKSTLFQFSVLIFSFILNSECASDKPSKLKDNYNIRGGPKNWKFHLEHYAIHSHTRAQAHLRFPEVEFIDRRNESFLMVFEGNSCFNKMLAATRTQWKNTIVSERNELTVLFVAKELTGGGFLGVWHDDSNFDQYDPPQTDFPLQHSVPTKQYHEKDGNIKVEFTDKLEVEFHKITAPEGKRIALWTEKMPKDHVVAYYFDGGDCNAPLVDIPLLTSYQSSTNEFALMIISSKAVAKQSYHLEYRTVY